MESPFGLTTVSERPALVGDPESSKPCAGFPWGHPPHAAGTARAGTDLGPVVFAVLFQSCGIPSASLDPSSDQESGTGSSHPSICSFSPLCAAASVHVPPPEPSCNQRLIQVLSPQPGHLPAEGGLLSPFPAIFHSSPYLQPLQTHVLLFANSHFMIFPGANRSSARSRASGQLLLHEPVFMFTFGE